MTEPKPNTSVRLSPEVNRARQEAGENFSENVDTWARQYYIEGMDPLPADALDELIESERETIRQLEAAVEAARERVERLEQMKAPSPASPEAREETLQEAHEALRSLPPGRRTAENPAVQNWARKLGMDPGELLADVPAYTGPKVLAERAAPSD